MANTLPVIIRIAAERDAGVDRALGGIEQTATKLGTAFDRAAAKLEALSTRLGSLGTGGGLGTAEQAAEGFSTAVERATARMADLDKRMEEVAAGAAKMAERLQAAGAGGHNAGEGHDHAGASAHRLSMAYMSLGMALQQVGMGLAVAGATLGGISLAVLKTAGDFEMLEAKLATVQGSVVTASETFERAQQFAAKTPFDVKGVVEASVQLEVYGQRSRDVLPMVAALAAGMGKSIEETGLVVGKALSGSLEGWESLRNEYGISTAMLARYGVELNHAGGILVQTEAQQQKANAAFAKIVGLKFGGAIERQAATMQGALSNAKDSVINLAGSLGQSLAPVVSFAARTFSGFIDFSNATPAPLKAIAAGGLVLAAGLTMMAGTATLATAGLLMLNSQLSMAAVELPIVAGGARLAAGALTLLGKAATGAGAAMTFLATNPFGIALTATVAAVSVLVPFLNSYENAQRELGSRITESSRQQQEAITSYRQITEAVNAAGKEQGVYVGRVASGSAELGKLGDAINRVSAADLAAEFRKQGKSVQDLKQELKGAREQLEGYITMRDALREAEASGPRAGTLVDISGNAKAVEAMGGRTAATVEQLTEAADKFGARIQFVKNQVTGLTSVVFKLGKEAQALERIQKGSEQLGDFIKFQDKIGDVESFRKSLVELDKQIKANQADLKDVFGPGVKTDRASLTQQLLTLDPKTQAGERQAVQAHLDLLDEVAAKQKGLAEKQLQLGRDRIKGIQSHLQQEKELRRVSVDEELKELERARQEALRLGKAGVNDVRAIENQIRGLKREARKQELDDAKASFTATIDAAQESIQLLQAEGKGNASEVKEALEDIILRIAAWKQANQGLLKEFPELAKQVENTVRRFRVDQVRAQVQELADRFSRLKDTIADLGKNAETSGAKLAAIERGIALATRERGALKSAGEDLSKVDELLEDLGQQRLNVERDITRERERQALEIGNEQIKVLQQELQLLEQRREVGERVDNLLLAKRAELFQARIDALNAEFQAELKTATDKLAVEQKYQLRLKQLENERTLEYRRQQTEQEKDLSSSFKRREQIVRQGSASAARAQSVSAAPSASSAAPETPVQIGGTPVFRQPFGVGFFGNANTFNADAKFDPEARARADADRRQRFRAGNPLGVELIRILDEELDRALAERETKQLKKTGEFGTELFRTRLDEKLQHAGVDPARLGKLKPVPDVGPALGRELEEPGGGQVQRPFTKVVNGVPIRFKRLPPSFPEFEEEEREAAARGASTKVAPRTIPAKGPVEATVSGLLDRLLAAPGKASAAAQQMIQNITLNVQGATPRARELARQLGEELGNSELKKGRAARPGS